MSDDTQQPIIVKRIKKGGGGHHGGAWKIAYADFVTAMMAFFLLMWLLGSTAKGDLKGIADYFNTPLKVALMGGSGSGDSSSVLQGGGTDLTRSTGQVRQGEIDSKKRTINLQALQAEKEGKMARAEAEAKERARLSELKGQIEALVEANPSLRPFKNQLLLDITSEGLRIQIVDEKNRPMFDSASAELKPYTRDILHEIGRVLNQVENRLSLSGHTDATQYAGGDRGFSNWELSASRANASRRELIAGGMDEKKVVRVVGLASSILFDKDDPTNPINRRISIIVMNKRTEEALMRDGNSLDVEADKPLDPGDIPPQLPGGRAGNAE
ncbi:MAG: flagellar motor protein MotB [Sterolibacteriaceae bacterium]|uniref:Flagellar motor protein MotB n=1 Tax=Candidatus Methylophosphatis roskildensis TaxID=2899263 RepID=A0A9D7HLD0_9PROT|nr:flagellar motor protein MotB [Candidatus Methylophosphatis roskildensis]MBK7235917.1 flagellar motor protein MotB [Sterolibacteriaceae bacterium]